MMKKDSNSPQHVLPVPSRSVSYFSHTKEGAEGVERTCYLLTDEEKRERGLPANDTEPWSYLCDGRDCNTETHWNACQLEHELEGSVIPELHDLKKIIEAEDATPIWGMQRSGSFVHLNGDVCRRVTVLLDDGEQQAWLYPDPDIKDDLVICKRNHDFTLKYDEAYELGATLYALTFNNWGSRTPEDQEQWMTMAEAFVTNWPYDVFSQKKDIPPMVLREAVETVLRVSVDDKVLEQIIERTKR